MQFAHFTLHPDIRCLLYVPNRECNWNWNHVTSLELERVYELWFEFALLHGTPLIGDLSSFKLCIEGSETPHGLSFIDKCQVAVEPWDQKLQAALDCL